MPLFFQMPCTGTRFMTKSHFTHPILAGLLCFLLMYSPSTTAQAQAEEIAPQTKPTDGYEILQQTPDRIIAVLPNRLVVVAQELKASPVVSANVFVKAGSIYEQEFLGQGVSHALEHLVSGGTTTTRAETESNALLSKMGAQVNAATSLNQVRYFINTTKGHTEEAVDLLSDWVARNAVNEHEFEREKTVIHSEFAMGRGQPNRVMWKVTQAARWSQHPAGIPTIGYLEEFDKLTRDDLKRYYDRRYVPNNMVMVVAGDIDKLAIIKQVANTWKDIPAREIPAIDMPVEPELTLDQPRLLAKAAPVAHPQVRMFWPSTKLGDEHDYALDLLGGVLGQMESSRLTQSLRNEKRLVNSISAFNFSTGYTRGFFGVDYELSDAAAQNLSDEQLLTKVRSEVLAEIEKIKTQGVTQAELDRVRKQTVAYAVNSAQTAQGLAYRIGSDILTYGDPDHLQTYLQGIEKVTSEDIQKAAEALLTDNKRTEVVLLPQGHALIEKLPEASEKPKQTGEAEKTKVELDNRSLIATLKKETDSTAKEPTLRIDQAKMHQLSNGLRVIVQESTVVPSVSMQLFQTGGLLSDQPGQEGVANAVAMMQMRGTRSMTAQQLAQRIEDLGASISVNVGNNTTYTSATALKEDWKTIFGLMSEVVQHPSFPESEWQNMQRLILASIARSKDSIWTELRLQFRDFYYEGHQWSQLRTGRPDVVRNLSVADLKTFHEQHLGADQAVLVIVGDIKTAEALEAAEQLFGSLPEKAEKAVDAQSPKPRDAAVIQRRTNKEDTAAVIIGFGPLPTVENEDAAALRVLSYVFDRFPSGRLPEALRGQGPGLVYGVWAAPSLGTQPGHFEIGFNSTPESVSLAISRAVRSYQHVREHEVTADELAAAKAAVLTREYMGAQSNSQRATSLALDELYGLGIDARERLLEQVNALTAEQLQQVAAKYLTSPVFVIVTDKPMQMEPLLKAALGEVKDDWQPGPAKTTVQIHREH